MPTIWKFKLHEGRQTWQVPAGATFLTAQMQAREPVLWALVDPKAPTEHRTVEAYGPGQDLPAEPGRYIATFQMLDGQLVWHVFERVVA